MQQALDLSKKINDTKSEMNAYDSLAEFFTRSGKYPEALPMLLQGLKRYEQLHDQEKPAVGVSKYW
jgi:hypothetical protein